MDRPVAQLKRRSLVACGGLSEHPDGLTAWVVRPDVLEVGSWRRQPNNGVEVQSPPLNFNEKPDIVRMASVSSRSNAVVRSSTPRISCRVCSRLNRVRVGRRQGELFEAPYVSRSTSATHRLSADRHSIA